MRRRRKKVGALPIIITLVIIIVCVALLWQFIFRERFLKYNYPLKYTPYVDEYAQTNGLNKSLVYAVIRTESNFNPKAVSNIGALGLMQLTPDTFEWAQTKTNENESLSTDSLYDPQMNVHYGTVVLSSLLNEFGREDTALAAYHAGRTKVKSWLTDAQYSHDGKSLYHIPFADTRAYVKRVLASKASYQEIYKMQ